MTESDTVGEWLTRARSGEETAFLELWREFQPRLLRFLRVLQCADPDDVAGETWLQVVRDLDRFRGEGDDFPRWLFTVARHRAIDAARARQRRPVLPLPEDIDSFADGQAVEDHVLDALSAQDAVRLLSSLPADQGRAVALRVIAGLDTPATAAVLGRPRAAVRLALHRGLRTLAKNPELQALSGAADAPGSKVADGDELTSSSPASYRHVNTRR